MYFSKAQRIVLSSSLSVFLAGCGSPNYSPSEMHMSVEEVRATAPKSPENIPALVKATPTAPQLSANDEPVTFDVVVSNVPVRDLLFGLARDSGVNLDVDSGVGGIITMSALDQTLDAILDRIALQIPIRIERTGNAIVVKNDEPYFELYHVDYTSVQRTYSSSTAGGGIGGSGASSISNSATNEFWESFEDSIEQILEIELEEGDSAVGLGDGQESIAAANEAEASLNIENEYDFNSDVGILMVYAPHRVQREVKRYLDEVLSIVRRQVLLEATVVEVVLNNEYAQGVDWSLFNQFAKKGLALYQGANVGGAAAVVNEVVRSFTDTGTATFTDVNGDGAITPDDFTSTPPNDYRGRPQVSQASRLAEWQAFQNRNTVETGNRRVTAFNVAPEVIANPALAAGDADLATNGQKVRLTRTYTVTGTDDIATKARAGGLRPATSSVPGAAFTAAYRGKDLSAAVELLDRFGDARVLSSPRISVLNNQPALLRVTDQEVYFNTSVTDTINQDTGTTTGRSFSATPQTIDVGFSMNVLPYITEDDNIFLNLKPTVTRVLDYRRAPTLTASGANTSAGDNLVPIVRVRELESVMSLRDGEIAVMGGLLEDRTGDSNTSVPGLAELPGVGNLFQKKNETTFKTEFVVFIKARVIRNPSLHGDYADYRDLLPNSDFILRDRSNNGLPPRQKAAR